MHDDSFQPVAINIGFFGESMLEIGGSPLKKSFGGDVLNTAIYLSRLSQFAKVQETSTKLPLDINYITAMGPDSISQQLVAQWQQEGINTQWVVTVPDKKPGLYVIENTADGDRVFHYWRDDSAAKYYFQNASSPLEIALEQKALDIIYISGSSLAILSQTHRKHFIKLLQAFHAAGGKIIFDNNYRQQLWAADVARDCYLEILPLTDMAFLTDTDEEQVFGSDDADVIVQRCVGLGVKEIVIKRGIKPCVVYSGDGAITVPVNSVARVVDCCAAGDSFAAGYLFERLRGGSVRQAAEAGHKLAAQVIQYAGAIIPIKAMCS